MGNARKVNQNNIRKLSSVSKESKSKNGFYTRSDKKKELLKLYNEKPDYKKMAQRPDDPVVRIEPGRHWFQNTRTVSQNKLEEYREALAKHKDDPRSVLVKRTKLPLSLFDHSNETAKKRNQNLLTVSPFAETFSNNRRQKTAKLDVSSFEEMISSVAERHDEYETMKIKSDLDFCSELLPPEEKKNIEYTMLKGTSKRIWAELYKVVDSSDILIQVLDVRDPMGTRCYQLEQHLKKDKPFKHVIFLLNKCDLVPEWVTDKWVKVLTKEYPTVAFKSSIDHPFGKRALIGLLRQYADLMKGRKHVSVGLIGYPNVGKSSVINTLRGKKVCNVAPIPGETKVWQYIDLTSRVYMIDCPGVVYADSAANGDFEADIKKVLKGVVRTERIQDAHFYLDAVVDYVGKEKFLKFYDLPANSQWEDCEELAGILAARWGMLKKGGEPNTHNASRRVLNHFQRGKLPWFIIPSNVEENVKDEVKEEDIDEALKEEAKEEVKEEPIEYEGLTLNPETLILTYQDKDDGKIEDDLISLESLSMSGSDDEEGSDDDEETTEAAK